MSNKEQRRRKAAARASFLNDPWTPLLNRNYFGKESYAPRKWKRHWARQWAALIRFRLADRRYRRILNRNRS